MTLFMTVKESYIIFMHIFCQKCIFRVTLVKNVIKKEAKMHAPKLYVPIFYLKLI